MEAAVVLHQEATPPLHDRIEHEAALYHAQVIP
jgi:hypothetical protein